MGVWVYRSPREARVFGMDLSRAARMLAQENHGDWYADPWGWPELSIEVVDQASDAINATIMPTRGPGDALRLTPYFHVIDVPKSWLGTRPAVVQDPLSRLAYASAVGSIAARIHSGLPDWVYGWRFRGEEMPASSDEWAAYERSWPTETDTEHGLQTDITSFFASLSPQYVVQQVVDQVGGGVPTNVISQVLNAHDRIPGRSGLPQRSYASAILANSLLQPIDDSLATALARGEVRRVRRWMDDLSAEGDQAALYRLIVELQSVARSIGLELNHSKTHLTSAKASAERFSDEGRREIWAPLIRYVNRYTGEESELEEVDLTLVLEAETTLLDNPFKANRTTVRVTLSALEKYGSYERANEWLRVAHLLPHSADNLAGFFSGYLALEPWYSTTYVDWFVGVAESHWGALDWVAAHAARPLANVFLLEGAERVLRTWLGSGQTVPKVSIAASILAMRAPEYCRTVVWERASTTMDPLLLRTFALALATAGADRGRVRSVASQDERNFLLVRYLESRDWRLSTR